MRLTRATRTIGMIATVLAAAAALQACDTPVYQYSMYEWRPDRFEVRYFHRPGEQAAADATANERLRAPGPANLSFHSVEVAADGSVAQQHASAWRGHRVSELPLHVVSAPGHGPIFAGRLDAAMAGQLPDSPKRRELAGELSAGRAGVLVVLLDRAARDDERVLQVARDAATEAADGERTLGLVSVDRADPAERWLVRQLLAVEDDLTEIAGSMVFGAFGRGHVLPPFVGKGVTPQGMRDLIAFIHGPCACELKAANPGLDLLMSWNWDERLPQWATASTVQPSFVLFDFTTEPSGDGSEGADPDDPDREPQEQATRAPAAPVDPPLTEAAREGIKPQEVAEPSSPQPAVSPSSARVTAPTAVTIDAGSAPEPTPEPADTPTSPAPSSQEQARPPAPEQPAAAQAAQAPEAAAPDAPQDAAAAPPVRLVARTPELPTGRPARLEVELLPEDSSFGRMLALRLGLTLLVVTIVAAAGHLILRRAAREESDGETAGDAQ